MTNPLVIFVFVYFLVGLAGFLQVYSRHEKSISAKKNMFSVLETVIFFLLFPAIWFIVTLITLVVVIINIFRGE